MHRVSRQTNAVRVGAVLIALSSVLCVEPAVGQVLTLNGGATSLTASDGVFGPIDLSPGNADPERDTDTITVLNLSAADSVSIFDTTVTGDVISFVSNQGIQIIANDGLGSGPLISNAATASTAGGIFAQISNSASTGNLSIDVGGTITSAGGDGVSVTNRGLGQTDVNVVDVRTTGTSSFASGVSVVIANPATVANTNIFATGEIHSQTGTGVKLLTIGQGQIDIRVEDVTGGNFGIDAGMIFPSSQPLIVTANGTVTGVFGDGIRLSNAGSGVTIATVADAVTGGDDGIEISGAAADAAVVLTGNATVQTTGTDPDDFAIQFGDADDSLIFRGGVDRLKGIASGGIGTDTVVLNDSGVEDADQLIDFEILRMGSTAVDWVLNGDQTFSQIEVTAGRLNVGGTLSGDTSVASGATLSVATGGRIEAGTLTLSDGATLAFNGSSPGDAELVVDTIVTPIGGTAGISLAAINTLSSKPGTFALIADSVATDDISAALSGLSLTSDSNNGLLKYELASGASNSEIIAVRTFKTAPEIARDLGVSLDTAEGLLNGAQAMTGGGAIDLALTAALNAGGATAARAVDQMAVQEEMLGAGSLAAVQSGERVTAITGQRLADLRLGSPVQYASIGPDVPISVGGASHSTWMRSFFVDADQDDDGDFAGFTAETGGIAFGADTKATRNMRLGLAGAWSETMTQGKGAGRATLDTDSYQVTLYGDYSENADGSGFFVEGYAGYAVNSNEGSRDVLGVTSATSSYDSDQVMLGISAGNSYSVATRSGAWRLTPELGLAWTQLSTDAYTETGAAGQNQTIALDDTDILIVSFDARLDRVFDMSGGILVPKIRVGFGYDLIDDDVTATARFAGGGAAFNVSGLDQPALSQTFGLGVGWHSEMLSFELDYDAEIKSGYLAHAAQLELKLRF